SPNRAGLFFPNPFWLISPQNQSPSSECRAVFPAGFQVQRLSGNYSAKDGMPLWIFRRIDGVLDSFTPLTPICPVKLMRGEAAFLARRSMSLIHYSSAFPPVKQNRSIRSSVCFWKLPGRRWKTQDRIFKSFAAALLGCLLEGSAWTINCNGSA